MGEKFLNLTAVQVIKTWIKSLFATKEELEALSVINTVKVNGTALVPDANKAVDVAVPTKTSDLTNDSNYQTGSEVDAKIESAVVGALKPKGTITFAQLPPLTAVNLNNVYNISDSFTTTSDFVEGAGHAHSAGSNVAIINTGTDQNPVYKYDVMVGPTDLSAFWTSTTGQNNTLEAATTTEINNVLNAE